MKKTLRIAVTATLFSAMLGTSGMNVFAAADAGAVNTSTPIEEVYALQDQLQAELKSVLNERTAGGSRVGVVLRMTNTGAAVKRLADYELLVRTSDGAEYPVQPSAANAKAIQPKTSAELSFLTDIERPDGVQIAEVLLKEVDYYTYPKTETLVLSIPIVSRPWNGSEGAAADASVSQAWGMPFSFPSLQSPVSYKPVSISHETTTDKGTVYVVQLLASNTADHRVQLPDFTIDGRSSSKVFAGSRIEQEAISLEANEEAYVHYAISVDTDTVLTGLNVLTTEAFAAAPGSAPVTYKVGRLQIDLAASSESGAIPSYTLGTPMKLDAKSKWMHPDLQLSLVGLPIGDNEEEGTRTVTATFLITNDGNNPIPIPVFQTALLGSGGSRYDGSRQAAGGTPLLPQESVTVNYSFTLPASESGSDLVLNIEDPVTAAPYKTTIGAYRVDAVPYETLDSFTVYPFKIGVKSNSTSFLFNQQTLEYSYVGSYDLTIEREPGVRVDSEFPALLFELHDGSGRLVASSTNPLTGTGRLANGNNKIRFTGTTQNFDYPLTLHIYEVFKTDTGESKRLLTKMVQ
ncbi:hypothetical protein [Paenibacillus ginsengarvi]|uniref:DUF11 domain-containing protein n=1 Tax=Paenibacillus ginsengarvi TaxID=400777 RepID=A0A3B0CKJ3_9BACL|nr:hypothetical protein [Paenibacillus ginsengarvi]RKN84857.1 hypothetical protein D7M11_09990 [Paenibacillus ginsengarvi]